MNTQTEQPTLGELYNPPYSAGWRSTSLYSIADWVNGLAFKDIHFSKTGKPVIKIAEIKNGITSQTQFTNGSHEANVHIVDGDMLFAWSGQPETSIGVSVWHGQDGWLNQHIFKVLPKEEVDRDFLYFLLQYLNPYFVRIAKNKQTTGLGHVTKEDLRSMMVGIPTINGQRELAQVILPLEQKLELLRKQNETLEQIAQTIFNEWFVKPTADGSLPDGWALSRVGDIADVSIGRTPPRKEKQWFSLNQADKKWISIKDLGASGAYVDTTSEYLTTEAIQRFKIPLIPRGTVVVSFKLTVGRVAITTEDMYSNEAIAHIKTSSLPTAYTYLYFKGFDYNSLGSTSSIATAVNSESIRQMEILVPDSTTLQRFTDVVSPLFEKVLLNTKAIKTLSSIRDLLLPRLMSGELTTSK